TDSGNYDDGDEIAQWNGLTVPLIQTSVYLIRSSRWLWVDDTGTPGVTDDMLIAEDHPIFKGVGSAGTSLPMVTTTTNLSGTTDAGNGQALATHADGRLWIAYWEAEVEFYGGSGQVGAASRMFFAAGLNENSADKGNMNLTEDGQAIFLNAVAFMTGGISYGASDPSPADGVDDVIRDSVLSWVSNEYPGTSNLYMGTSFEDVNTMTVPTVSDLNVNSFDPGRLEFGQTYFWRVDEVNASPDKTVFTGNVWSFTAEPYSIQIPGDSIDVTASSSSNEFSTPDKTIDGSGLGVDDTHATNAETMWFT
ncbi:MAG: hypothetical protein GY809_14615, partial [Planctomycetes bacterium]|nr:hypothetical protein [Planctomycetota bacterium]